MGWFEKLRSEHEEEVGSMCVTSEVIRLRPYENVVKSILDLQW